jgi:phage terminase Nu1 subunit (DNA packaging protein)
MAEKATVPAETLAKLLNLTEVRIQQLAKDGIIVKETRGRYDLWASIKGYVKYLQDRAIGRGVRDDEGGDYEKHRGRLTKAKADEAERIAALNAGRSHDATAVELVWADMIQNAKTRLSNIPAKATPEVRSILPNPKVYAILERHINEALAELSDYDPSRLTASLVQEDSEEMEPAEEADGEHVGGHEAETVR